MLLDNNSDKVVNLLNSFSKLNNIDKLRLSIYLMENLWFATNYDIDSIISLLKDILGELDPNYKKVIVNFANYQSLLFLASKYIELSDCDKQRFSAEMLFNIYENDFNDENINKQINDNLNVYDYCYSLNLQ